MIIFLADCQTKYISVTKYLYFIWKFWSHSCALFESQKFINRVSYEVQSISRLGLDYLYRSLLLSRANAALARVFGVYQCLADEYHTVWPTMYYN